MDDKKERAAGRLKEQRTQLPIDEDFGESRHSGRTGGAFGGGPRPASNLSQGAGGGGGSQQAPKD